MLDHEQPGSWCRSRAKEKGHSYRLVNQKMHDLLPISEAKAFDRILFWIRVNKWTTRPFTLLATASRYAWADTLSTYTELGKRSWSFRVCVDCNGRVTAIAPLESNRTPQNSGNCAL